MLLASVMVIEWFHERIRVAEIRGDICPVLNARSTAKVGIIFPSELFSVLRAYTSCDCVRWPT